MLARGELQTIGATALDGHRKYVEKGPAVERRFQPIQVGEPTVAHTIEILRGLRDRYEAHHRVTISDKALEAAATLADRYISDGSCPPRRSYDDVRRRLLAMSMGQDGPTGAAAPRREDAVAGGPGRDRRGVRAGWAPR